jgi:RHS repeat-associated protein
VLNSYQNGPGIDNKLKSNVNGARYYMQDHLGSTIGSAANNGLRRDTINYDSYGNSDAGGSRYQHQFTGREKDVLTGLQYSRARFYDPQIGRFISEDPIGFEGGNINLYGYVWNSPVQFNDPTGLDGPHDEEQLWKAQQDLLEALAPVIRGGVGFGDEATMGISRIVRQLQGIDDPDMPCSWEYKAGGYLALAAEVAAGGAGGLRAAGVKGAGMEFSHWVPRRFGGARSIFNGNYVTVAEHALSDPYRYRFMPRIWKAGNPLPNVLTQQWNRIPKVFKGAGAGAIAGSVSLLSTDCECK